MFYQTLKKLSWIIILCFALLQAIAPFIHTHLGAEHLNDTASLHIHADKHDHITNHHGDEFASEELDTLDTLSVSSGFINDSDNHVALYIAVLFLYCLLCKRKVVRRFYSYSTLLQEYSSNWRVPAPRAPPAI